MVEEEYKFITKWLREEEKVDLVIPYIKERKEKGVLSKDELESLRHQVLRIKKNGHDAYLNDKAEDILFDLFPDAIEVGDE